MLAPAADRRNIISGFWLAGLTRAMFTISILPRSP